jgi:hypothetical protein
MGTKKSFLELVVLFKMENDSLPKIKKGNPHNAESAKKGKFN